MGAMFSCMNTGSCEAEAMEVVVRDENARAGRAVRSAFRRASIVYQVFTGAPIKLACNSNTTQKQRA